MEFFLLVFFSDLYRRCGKKASPRYISRVLKTIDTSKMGHYDEQEEYIYSGPKKKLTFFIYIFQKLTTRQWGAGFLVHTYDLFCPCLCYVFFESQDRYFILVVAVWRTDFIFGGCRVSVTTNLPCLVHPIASYFIITLRVVDSRTIIIIRVLTIMTPHALQKTVEKRGRGGTVNCRLPKSKKSLTIIEIVDYIKF